MLCKAHPLRELIFQAETCHASFAPSLIDLLCEANTQAARSAQRHIRQELQRHYRERYDPIVDHAQWLPPAQPPTGQRGRAKQSGTVDLLRRLHDPAEETLRFLADPRVPGDNN